MYGDITTQKERLYKPLPLWARDLIQGMRITLGVCLGMVILWFLIISFKVIFG